MTTRGLSLSHTWKSAYRARSSSSSSAVAHSWTSAESLKSPPRQTHASKLSGRTSSRNSLICVWRSTDDILEINPVNSVYQSFLSYFLSCFSDILSCLLLEDFFLTIKFNNLLLGDKESLDWFLETKSLHNGSWRERVSRLVIGDKESPDWFLETKGLQIGSWRQRVSTMVLGDKESP